MLKPESSIKEAQTLCKYFCVSHIFIVKNDSFLGSIAQSDIQSVKNKEKKLKECLHLLSNFYALKTNSFLQLLSLFSDNDCNVLPVLDENSKYVGYYSLADVLEVFASSPFLYEKGETIIVEKNKYDHSMSRLAQIVESNNALLLGCYVLSETANDVQIILKIKSDEINEVIQTFRRYDYYVVSNHTDDFYLKDLKDRADYLSKYLEM